MALEHEALTERIIFAVVGSQLRAVDSSSIDRC